MMKILILTLFSFNAFGFMARPSSNYPQSYNQATTNNYNYWGPPWGASPSLYHYPSLPYYGMWAPQHYPFYIKPPGRSPYAPSYHCPTCSGAGAVPYFFQ